MEVILGKGLRTKNLGVNTSLPEHIQQQTEKKKKMLPPWVIHEFQFQKQQQQHSGAGFQDTGQQQE